MERRYDVQVLVIGIRSEDEARMMTESLPSELESEMVSVKTWEQFRHALRKHVAPIVHIVDRNPGADTVELEDTKGVMRSADVYTLAGCRDVLVCVEAVILDGCYGEHHARSWLKHVNSVIGIPASVSLNASTQFACELYRALDDEPSLEKAFDACPSRQHIELLTREGNASWLAQTLRAETDTRPIEPSSQRTPSKGSKRREVAAGTDTRPKEPISQSTLGKVATLRGLLLELRKGYTLYKPILIEVEPGSRIEPEKTVERTLTLRKPMDWAQQYSREYAGHAFVVLGPNILSAGLETPLTIGRSRRSDIRIDNDSVSKVHASIVFDRASGEYYVVDEHTRNGTCINGEALTPGVPAAVWSGAYVSFGDALFVFIDPPTLRKLAKVAL